MANKMLIDASHQEETRVVVVRGSRIEEFDFESEHKKQLKGNIYLAKVTRVEPSLQAAFVEYGGNRHGFLAFSEIHPDYYQIPVADRQALIEEELARVQEDEDQEERSARAKSREKPRRFAASASDAASDDSVSEPYTAGNNETSEPYEARSDESPAEGDHRDSHGEDASETENIESRGEVGESVHPQDPDKRSDDIDGDELRGSADEADSADDEDEVDEAGRSDEENGENRPRRSGRGRRTRGRSRHENGSGDENGEDESDQVDQVGAEDAMEEVPVRQSRPRKQYKIQEVIKRRQILLVQVVKEERGNKGAALTTYLSLAGRYSVLMPNTARGGGISRKITNAADRKRLKDVARELEVPRGMGIILRTAGANRTKAEVKRDYEYLMRLWETVRNLTLSSTAPALVYEEGSLIKRSIRDLYNKDIDQILVSGENGYREAKDFMRMLMPSQAKVVQPYRDPTPIFARQGIEPQLDRMLQPHVTLKSGGYIIINQTEALVAIDVNSGRSTREHSVEDTAYQTNMEAAEEVARQLRLRDLAGLVVVDFIDMEEKRNNRSVEKKMKDCLKDDRARIQVGRISHFGLMEMSRQRIRASVLESTMQACPVCEGTGHIRSSSSLALHVLRTIEEHLQKHSTHDLIVKVPTSSALYVLNEKRWTIDELERRYGLRIIIHADDSGGHQSVQIEHGEEAAKRPRELEYVLPAAVAAIDAMDEAEDEKAAADAEVRSEPNEAETVEERQDPARRRKRRSRSGRRDEEEVAASVSQADGEAIELEGDDDAEEGQTSLENGDDSGRSRKRRRRGRRGGRRNRDGEAGQNGDNDNDSGDSEEREPAMASDRVDAFGADGDDQPSVDANQPLTAWSASVDDTGSPADYLGSDDVQIAADNRDSGFELDDRSTPIEDANEFRSSEEPVVALEDWADESDDESPPERPRDERNAPNAYSAGENADDAMSGVADQLGAGDQSDADVAERPAAPVPPREPQVTSTSAEVDEEKSDKPKRTGWWARRSFF